MTEPMSAVEAKAIIEAVANGHYNGPVEQIPEAAAVYLLAAQEGAQSSAAMLRRTQANLSAMQSALSTAMGWREFGDALPVAGDVCLLHRGQAGGLEPKAYCFTGESPQFGTLRFVDQAGASFLVTMREYPYYMVILEPTITEETVVSEDSVGGFSSR